MTENISHSGRVISITPEVTKVEFTSESACGACHAAGLCSLSEVKKKEVEVPTRAFSTLSVGDEVDVQLTASLGLKAVFVSYMIPLIILMLLTLGLSALGFSELVAGLGSIGGVALYYFGLWLFRKRIKKEYVFTLKEK